MADPLPWPELDPFPEGWLDDTPYEAVVRWRRLTPADRFAAFLRARETVWRWSLAGERMRYPDRTDAEHMRAVRERLRVGGA